MKNFVVIISLICFFTVACKKSPEKVLLVSAKSDTIFLKDHEILFISPSDKNISKLKIKHGDDFYTIADDANNYFYEATTFLDSLKLSYKNYDDDKIIGFKTNNKFIKIPKYKNPWYLIFYKNGTYETLDLINIRKEYSKFFSQENPNHSKKLNSKKIIDSVAGKKYFVVEEKDCDLNNDTFKDKIVVLGNNNDINPQDPDTKTAPILILLNEQNNKYQILANENIYPNDFGDSFERLVIKDQYFTVELLNEVSDQYISKKYITFKFIKKSKEIVLSKYGENLDWSNGKKNHILCSENNFGKITFQEYNSNNIQNECSH